jgi:hypothetical protein
MPILLSFWGGLMMRHTRFVDEGGPGAPQKFTVAYCGLLTMRRWPTCAPLHSPSAWALECADPSDVGMLTSLGKPWWCQGQTYNLRHKKSFTGGYGSIPIDRYKVLTHPQIIYRSSLASGLGECWTYITATRRTNALQMMAAAACLKKLHDRNMRTDYIIYNI